MLKKLNEIENIAHYVDFLKDPETKSTLLVLKKKQNKTHFYL